jgi:hypothetical protein
MQNLFWWTFARGAESPASGTRNQDFIPSVNLNVGELIRGDGSISVGKGNPRFFTRFLNEESPGSPFPTAVHSPGTGNVPIHETGDGYFGRAVAQNANAPEASAMPSVAAGFFRKPVFKGKPGVSGLKNFDRSIPTVPVDRALGMITITMRLTAPSTAIDVVIRIVMTGIGMNAAEKEVTGTTPAGSGDPFGDGLSEASEENVNNAFMHL